MEDLSKYEEDFFLFLEAGFIAINQADEESAVRLFDVCEFFKPDNPLIDLGRGYLAFHKLELNAAIGYFQGVLERDPDNEMAQVFLAMSKSLTPKQMEEGEKLLKKSAQTASDAEVKNVAHISLDFVENFVKKAPGPAEVKSSE